MTDSNVIYGVDFKAVKNWPEQFYDQPAGSYVGTVEGIPVFQADQSDTTPSDYVAPSDDCA